MVPFKAHVELLSSFVADRSAIVERIQELLTARRRPGSDLQDAGLLRREIEHRFAHPGLGGERSQLRGELEEAYWKSAFRPRNIPGLRNGLVDPGEMAVRAFHLWQQTRWPGRNGRIRYAHTLFSLYVLRSLEILSMRLWDAADESPGHRLSQIQAVLDRLSSSTPRDLPVFVRDARWLVQLAQSPATDDLSAYFDVAEKIADTLPEHDRIEIHKAGVRMAGGHLRSQIRYYSLKNATAFDDHALMLSTRNSNALDFALLIQELVPLLAAYDRACLDGDVPTRLALAGAILQGVSPDPALLLNRLDLLRAYSMIEHVFITTDAVGTAIHTPHGRRHVRLLEEYGRAIARVAPMLLEDYSNFTPVPGSYSPYGVIYGFTGDLLEHMALKTVQTEADARFGLEDVFDDGGAAREKLAWVSGWRNLPHITPEMQRMFEYPQRFAEDIFTRLGQALRDRADQQTSGAPRHGRIFVTDTDAVPDLPVEYIASSDEQLASANKALFVDDRRILVDRSEGKYIVSYQTAGGWVGITKDILTDVLGAARDVKLVGLSSHAVGVLRLMCPALLVLPEGSEEPGT
jgi:hypothetical protein